MKSKTNLGVTVFRKVAAIVLAFILAFTGFGGISPANAWPDFTVSPTNLAVDVQGAWTVPVGKTVTSDAVFVYAQEPQDSGPRFLKSYTVSPSGEIRGPYVITYNNQQANYRIERNTVWVDVQGKFNVIYWSWGETNTGLESKLYHTVSSDGTAWSTPELLDTVLNPSSDCQQIWCGIRSASIATNALGTVALNYTTTEGAAVNRIYIRTKVVGKAWSAKEALVTLATGVGEVVLKPLGKGWLAAWSTWGSRTAMYSAYSTSDKLSTWTAPQLRTDDQCAIPRNIMQIAPTKYGLIYLTDCQEGSGTHVYKFQPFDLLTKRFGSAVVLDTVPNRGFSYTYETPYLAGQSAFAFSVYAYEQGDSGFAKYVLFKNGVPSTQYVAEDLITAGGTQTIGGMQMDPLGHLTVVWNRYSGSALSVKISQIYRGTRADIAAPMDNLSSSESPVVFSPDGDVYISNVLNGHINAVERIRSDTPEISGSIAITGAAKANGTLKAKLPKILPSQLFQTWSNSYQWLACQYQVPESSTNLPVTCTELTGATAASYKATTAVKGKYLVLKLTVKSDNASQVQYSSSTLAVK